MCKFELTAVVRTATVVVLGCAGQAQVDLFAGAAKIVESSHIGWMVNGTTHGDICTVSSGNECQRGKLSSEPGGFGYPSSVAVDPRSGALYVADTSNNRIQEFTAGGAFVAAFGWNVNRTKDNLVWATQAERNICTAVSRNACTAGRRGSRAEQFAYPVSVAIDPIGGYLYVLEVDVNDLRVDKYTVGGRFVWMVGKNVNKSRKSDLCTEQEVYVSGVQCGAGMDAAMAGGGLASFKFVAHEGNLLAAGGPKDLLYVGDEHRVQEFDADGRWKGEILLASISAELDSRVVALAVDKGGDLYIVYNAPNAEADGRMYAGNMVHEFGPNGEQILEFPIYTLEPNAPANIDGMAVAPYGRLAVIGVGDRAGVATHFGSLYDIDTGRPITEFAVPTDFDGMALSGDDDLYIAATDRQEIVAYTPASVSELVAPPVDCEIGVHPGTIAAFNCAPSWETTL